MTNIIYIPVEYFRREFIAKATLAIYLSIQGATVVIGHKWYVRRTAMLNGKSGDVYIHNHANSINDAEDLQSLKDRNFILIGYEDEGALDYVDYKKQLYLRNQQNGFEKFDMWLCWGKNEYAVLRQLHDNSTKFKCIGTPRSAVWGEVGKNIWAKEITKVVEPKYRNYVLIATSFHSKSHLSFATSIGRLNRIYRGNSIDQVLEQSAKEALMEEQMINQMHVLINDLLKETKFNIVLRPYFTRDSEIENQLQLINPERIFIEQNLDITPLIIAARAVLHMGSTVAIESIINDKKTIFIRPFLENQSSVLHKDYEHLVSSAISIPLAPNSKCSTLLDLDTEPSVQVSNFVISNSEINFYSEFSNHLKALNHTIFDKKSYIKLKKAPFHQLIIYRTFTFLKRSNLYKYDRLKRPALRTKFFKMLVQKVSPFFGMYHSEFKVQKIERSTYVLTRT